jgi:hypothetical protein
MVFGPIGVNIIDPVTYVIRYCGCSVCIIFIAFLRLPVIRRINVRSNVNPSVHYGCLMLAHTVFRVFVRRVRDLQRGVHPHGIDDRLLGPHALPRPLHAAQAPGDR